MYKNASAAQPSDPANPGAQAGGFTPGVDPTAAKQDDNVIDAQFEEEN